MKPAALRGSLVALVTPFDATLALDESAYLELIDWHISQQTSAIIVAGTTGEATQLNKAEYQQLLTKAVERVDGRIPVIAGTGYASTSQTIEQTKLARECGANAALVVTPYYVRPPQEGLFQHYCAVADEGGLPVILYNVPARTGVDLQPDTVARLAAHPNIIGVKEAKSDLARIQELLKIKRTTSFAVLSGDDETAAGAVQLGADGVISVVANVLPSAMAALMDAAHAHDPAVEQLNQALQPLMALMGIEPNPIPVKWALHELKRCAAHVRLPLVELSATHRPKIIAALRSLEARLASLEV